MLGRWVLVLALIPWTALPLSAQAPPPPNRLYGEILGPGLIYSLNYERQVGGPIALRVGVSGWPQSGFRYVLGHGMVLARRGSDRHAIFVGLGAGLAWFADVDLLEQTDVVGGYGAALVAYQVQLAREGPFLRISYSPLISAEAIAPLWGGLAVGWSW